MSTLQFKRSYFNFNFLLVLVCCGLWPISAQAQTNWTEIDARADAILKTLSLKQKVGQTCQITVEGILRFNSDGSLPLPLQVNAAELNEALRTYHVGSILNAPGRAIPRLDWLSLIQAIHAPYLKKEIAVPVLYGVDAIHGANYVLGATLFPQEIGLAATFNADVARQFGEITAMETRSSGVPWNFSPVLDLGRQPLWSRFFETLGEDPKLASVLGTAIVSGYQGDLNASKLASNRVLACMKHFAGYSAPASGRDRTPAIISPRDLTELYLPPFKSAVDAGALTVMINSASLNGMPGHINAHLITDVLKNQWGFKGFAVTDWEDILFLERVHQVAPSHKEAIAMAINAGIDMSMVPLNPQYKEYCRLLEELVLEGRVPMARLDDAVKRILRVKLAAGLFDMPSKKSKQALIMLQAESSVAAAKQAVSESLTLLKNENSVLPLQSNSSVLVLGQAATDRRFWNGAWTHTWQGRDSSYFSTDISLLKEWQRRAEVQQGQVQYLTGSSWAEASGLPSTGSGLTAQHKKALESADVCVVFVSEWPGTEKPGDEENPFVTQNQMDLVHELKAAGKRVVVVLMLGRPKLLGSIVDDADAIVHAYLPGEHFTQPFLDKMYGAADFSGRLPFTYPRHPGRWEHYDHAHSENIGKDNSLQGYNPAWDFGQGMSYASWTVDASSISADTLRAADTVWLELRLRHNADRPCQVSVPVFASRRNLPIAQRGKYLIDFQKKWVPQGSAVSFRFPLTATQFEFADYSGNRTQSRGPIRLQVFDSTLNLFLEP